MNNINLLESAQNKDGYNQDKKGKNSALVTSSLILILTFLVWGGAKFYSSYLDKQIAGLQSESQAESASLSGKSVDRVADFDERMNRALKESSSRSNFVNCLKDLENVVVSGARIDLVNYSKEKTEMKVAVDSFQTIARQILSFKNSQCFKDLEMGETTRDTNGKISFTLKNN
ncbi:MAG: hypothetical protein V1804_03070 [Patescibacteria group bacterium]